MTKESLKWLRRQVSKNGIDHRQQAWLDEQIEKATPTEPNPCVRLFGVGPAGAICKNCARLYGHRCSRKTYYKCNLRKHTNGPGSDHKVRWNACAKFEERKDTCTQ